MDECAHILLSIAARLGDDNAARRKAGSGMTLLKGYASRQETKEGAFLAVLCSLPHSTTLWWKEGKGIVTLNLQLQTFFAGTSEWDTPFAGALIAYKGMHLDPLGSVLHARVPTRWIQCAGSSSIN